MGEALRSRRRAAVSDIGDVRWPRVVLGGLFLGVVITAMVSWRLLARLEAVEPVLASGCGALGGLDEAAGCMQRQLSEYLADPHWMARLFVGFVGVAFVFGWLLLWRGSRPLSEAASMALLGGGLVVAIVQPGGLPATGLVVGVLLAGLLRRWWVDRAGSVARRSGRQAEATG